MIKKGTKVKLMKFIGEEDENSFYGSKNTLTKISDFIGKIGEVIGVDQTEIPYSVRFTKNTETFDAELKEEITEIVAVKGKLPKKSPPKKKSKK